MKPFPGQFPVTVCVLAILGFACSAAYADKIHFKNGAVWEGVIHEENFYFPERRNDPNFIEIEVLRGNQVICLGLDLVEQGERVERIERNEAFTFPPGVELHPNLEAAKQRYQEEQERKAREATPTPSADVELSTEVIYARGWAFRGDGNRQVQIIEGLIVPENAPIETRWNTRVKFRAGQALVIGLDQKTSLRYRSAVWDQVQKNYRVDLPIEQGLVWLEKQENSEAVQKILVQTPPLQITLGNSLVRVVARENGHVRVGVFRGQPVEVQAGAEKTTLPAGRELVRDSQGRLSTGDLPALSEGERWDDWPAWQPVEVDLRLDLEFPGVVPAPLKPIGYALPSLGSAERGLAGAEPRAMTMVDIFLAWRNALDRYREDTGRFPDERIGLRALRENPGIEGWKGPYVPLNLDGEDVWGNPLVYKLRDDGNGARNADVYSPGPNGRDDDRFGDDVY